MNLDKLKTAIEEMRRPGERSLLIRIEMRILTRLYNHLKGCSPSLRVNSFKEFWAFYLRLPRTLKEGIGVHELRDRARDILGIDPIK